MSIYESDSGGFIEENRETVFVVGVLVGMIVFAFGFAFFIIGITTDTTPPAPYFATLLDRLLTIAVSVGALVVGGAVVRWATQVAGW